MNPFSNQLAQVVQCFTKASFAHHYFQITSLCSSSLLTPLLPCALRIHHINQELTVFLFTLQTAPQCLSSRSLPPLQSVATLQVSTLTEPWCSGREMERRFMRTWTKERSSPTMMEASRWVLTWNFLQTNMSHVVFWSVSFIQFLTLVYFGRWVD